MDDDIPTVDISEVNFEESTKDEEDEEKAEQHRIDSYLSTMDGVNTCIQTLQSRINTINESVDTMSNDLEMMDENEPARMLFGSAVESIKSDTKVAEDAANNIVTYFKLFVSLCMHLMFVCLIVCMQQSKRICSSDTECAHLCN